MGPHELKIGIKFDLVVFEGVEKYTLMQPYYIAVTYCHPTLMLKMYV